MKIAYCGYDFFYACLNQLLADSHDIYHVFSFSCDNRYNFNQYIRDICQEHELPFSEQIVDERTIKKLEEDGCELLITAGYRYKIPDLASSSIKGINVHPTLLPVGRGVWPLPWTILTNQKQTGVSIHKLASTFDAGDILLQRGFAVDDNECLESLSAKTQLLAKDLLRDMLENFDRHWNNAQPQIGTPVTWAMPNKLQRTLQWNKGIKELDRNCRAFGKFGSYAHFDNQDWIVYGLRAWYESHSYEPGSVVHKTNTEMIVAARDGLVSLLYFESAK